MAREGLTMTMPSRPPTRWSAWRDTLRGIPVLAAIVLVLILLLAALAPLIAAHDPRVGALDDNLLPPAWDVGGSWTHPLGTDFLGRDVLSIIIHGTRVVVIISIIAVPLSGGVGLLLGVLSGYSGGWIDVLIMRLTDAFLAVPFLVLAILYSAAFGGGLRNMLIVLVVTGWARYARQIRAEVLTLREMDFVKLARVAGASRFRIIVKHIIPNVMNTFIVLASLALATVVVAEAALSFLGLGIRPPNPSWGLLMSQGRQYIADAWWIATFPGIALTLTVLSVNALGNWLRRRLDPKLRQI